MCRILMSINPEYVDKILNGKKKYEYRKIKAKKQNINRIVIYATAPIMQVVGEVEVKNIIEDTPNSLWKKTKEKSGVKKDFYDSYYKNKNKAIAYELGDVIIYNTPITLSDLGINYIPQSYIYLD